MPYRWRIQHLFLTKYGVYLLVFDMREVVSKKSKEWQEYLRFWLNSIQLHASSAPLLLVGTFYDKIRRSSRSSPLKNIDQSLEEALELSKRHEQQLLIYNDNAQLNFFPLDNYSRGRNQYGISDIRQTIDETTRMQPFVHEEISSHWVSTVDVLTGKTVPFMHLKDVRKVAKEVNMTNEEVDAMLRLFHELGVLIYLTSTELLKESVVIDPQWLLDKFSRVIWDQAIHLDPEHPKGFNLGQLKHVGLHEDFMRLKDHALVTKDLLRYLWQEEKVDFLIDFMKQSFLMTEYGFSGELDYLVPAMLADKAPRNKKPPYSCIVDFSKSFLPIGVFQRLVCLLVAASGQTQNARPPALSSDFATIWLGSNLALQVSEQVENERLLVGISEASGASVALATIQASLNKLNNSMNRVLQWDLMFSDEGGYVSYAEAKGAKLLPWFPTEAKKSLNVEDFLDL